MGKTILVVVGHGLRVSDRTHMGKEIIVLMAVGHGFRVSDRTHTWDKIVLVLVGHDFRESDRTKLFWWWSVTFLGCRTGHTRGEQNCSGGGRSHFSGVGQDTHVENKIVLVVVGHIFRVSDRTHTWRTKLFQVVVGHGFRVSDKTHTWRTKLFWWWLVTVLGCRTGHTHGEQNCPGGGRSRFSGVGQDTRGEQNCSGGGWSRFSGVGQDTHVENKTVQATWWLVTVFACRKRLERANLGTPPPPFPLSPINHNYDVSVGLVVPTETNKSWESVPIAYL